MLDLHLNQTIGLPFQPINLNQEKWRFRSPIQKEESSILLRMRKGRCITIGRK